MSPQDRTAAEFSAKRLALIQFYATQIEGLAIMIYRSDPPKYDRLSGLLQLTIRELKVLAKQELEGEARGACDPGEERCADGLCHPKNDPTCCEIIIPVDTFGEQN